MHLVLYLCEQSEHFARYRHLHFLRWETKEQGLCAVLVVLLQSGDRDTQAQLLFHRLADSVHLPDAAVGNNQVWQLPALFDHVAVSTAHYLTHTRVVIGSFHRLYLKTLIVLLARLCHPKDDTPCHGVGAVDVGVVETIDESG